MYSHEYTHVNIFIRKVRKLARAKIETHNDNIKYGKFDAKNYTRYIFVCNEGKLQILFF